MASFLKLGGGYIGVDRVFSLIKNEKKREKRGKRRKRENGLNLLTLFRGVGSYLTRGSEKGKGLGV